MSAPKGNQFWKLRSKHGVDKLFATPELLWSAACEYFEWCENNPLYKVNQFAFQGMVTQDEVPLMRAMTLSQLCFYLNCNEAYFRTFKKQLKDIDQDFNTVISDIEATIYNQKFQGASAGLLNANIIARDLGLKDSQDITSDGEKIQGASSIVIVPYNPTGEHVPICRSENDIDLKKDARYTAE
jgi:hypothetical protein